MNNKWVTIDQAATILGVSAMTVRRRIDKGALESKLENRRRLVCITNDSQMIHSDEQLAEQLRRENEILEKQIDIQNEQIKELREELKQEKERLQQQLDRKEEQTQILQTQLGEASNRHDTVVMQMTRLLEYYQQPFWRRLFSRKALPPPDHIVDMEPGGDKAEE